MKIMPFSDNVIFFDTEFSTLNPYEGEILSVGLVKMGGQELYLELEYEGAVSDWVKENILPTLTAEKVSRTEAVRLIKEFVGDSRPYAVSYVNQFDTIYVYKPFSIDDHPFFWIPIDFASFLFMAGIDPTTHLYGEKTGFFSKLGIDSKKYHQHHALDDARILREAYLKFLNQPT
ncbi:MAG: hypothetical protein PHT12_04430 [Patescibacteria group bacterium]|nr:hypothetical protein [Patescibacteria group bacterium]